MHTGKYKPRQKTVFFQLGTGGALPESLGEPGYWDHSKENRAGLSGTFDSTWQDSAQTAGA